MTSKTDVFTFIPRRLGLMRMGVGRRFLLCVAVMVTYMVISRIIYDKEALSFAEVELLRTPFRLVGALLFWLLLADVIFAREPRVRVLRNPLALIALSLFFVTPILTYHYEVSAADATILAMASVPVALFEELFFRAILQTLLVKYVGAFQGICFTCICFVVFHLGATPTDIVNLALIFLAGVVFSLIYFKTASLLVVTLAHAADDVLVGLPFDAALPLGMALVFVLAAVLLLIRWASSHE